MPQNFLEPISGLKQPLSRHIGRRLVTPLGITLYAACTVTKLRPSDIKPTDRQ